MYKPPLFNDKTNQVLVSTSQILTCWLPAYIQSLPSIRAHLIRWLSNVIYLGLGLCLNWGVHAVLQRMPNMTQFPSTVACLIVIFFLLMCSRAVFPKQTDRFVAFVDPYSSFTLRSMNIMFVPPVVAIVENAPVAGSEIGKMMCVFLVGYFCSFIITTIFVRVIRYLLWIDYLQLFKNWRSKKEEPEAIKEVVIDLPEPKCEPESESMETDTNSTRLPSHVPSIRGYCYCSLDDPAGHRHGPLHDIAIWCMKESNFDDLAFFCMFVICAFVFLPLPEDSPVMPFFRLFLYFNMTVLMYSFFARMPPGVRRFFHPIIVSAAAMMAAIGYFERAKGFDIIHGVERYKAGITFIGLVEKTNVGWPGGGDLFAATMDVAIISLSFNIYQRRPEQLKQWIVIVGSIVPMAFLVMFVTPMFASGIGCTPSDSLAWSSRSVTTAIGLVISRVLGSDQSVVTCIIVFTGIMGPIIGPSLLKLARVRDDDYLTIGIAMGSNSHGAGTAYLVRTDPKASGMASIAFAIFGIIGVVVASIPTLSDTIKNVAGY